MEHPENQTRAVSAGTRSDRDKRAILDSLKRISSLYAVGFLILCALVVGFIWHELRADYRSTLAYWNAQLSSSVDQWVGISALWLDERRTDTIAVAENPWTVRLLSAGESRGNVAEIRQEVGREIAHIAAVNGFLGGAVGDRDCQIVEQTGLRPEMAQGVQEACVGVQQAGEYRVAAFGMEQGHVWISLSAPVFAEGRASSSTQITRRMVGSVIMVVEDWRRTLRFFTPGNPSTRTSEGLLVWKKGTEAFIFSSDLLARGEESFFRRPLTGSAFESRVALAGDVAFGEFIDYRGKAVLGVARRIGVPGYSLARKVARNEALSEYRRRGVSDWLVGILSLLLLGSVMVTLQWHAAARDFKERARQQEMLSERDRRYKVLFESAGDAIFLMRGGHFVDCNQKSLELFGCGREQLIGSTPSAFSPPQQPTGQNSQEAAEERMRLGLEGKTLHFEWQHRRWDGTAFEAEVTLSRLEIAGEAHLLALVRDVADRKRAEGALQASEARFRTLMERAPVAISLSRYGLTLFVNQKYLELYGFASVDELVGRSIGEQWSPAFRAMVEERARQRSVGLPAPARYEAVGQRKDGSQFPVEVAVAIVDLPDGEASVGFLTDITERKRAQEDRQRSLDQLRALAGRLQSIREEERKRVAREIHDQLGQALTALKIDLSSLIHDLPAAKKEGSESVLNLIDQTIQSVRRISTELRPGILDDLGLVAAVEWAGEEFEARTGTTCRLDLPRDDIAVDPEQATAIFRIFQETLTNVARHADASDVKVRLTREDGDLTLEVHDNGKGIPQDKLSSGESLGILGMRERAMLLGGELTISGPPENGTTVRVRIPQPRQNQPE
jgi:PAS domain S-box-containing protein